MDQEIYYMAICCHVVVMMSEKKFVLFEKI